MRSPTPTVRWTGRTPPRRAAPTRSGRRRSRAEELAHPRPPTTLAWTRRHRVRREARRTRPGRRRRPSRGRSITGRRHGRRGRAADLPPSFRCRRSLHSEPGVLQNVQVQRPVHSRACCQDVEGLSDVRGDLLRRPAVHGRQVGLRLVGSAGHLRKAIVGGAMAGVAQTDQPAQVLSVSGGVVGPSFVALQALLIRPCGCSARLATPAGAVVDHPSEPVPLRFVDAAPNVGEPTAGWHEIDEQTLAEAAVLAWEELGHSRLRSPLGQVVEQLGTWGVPATGLLVPRPGPDRAAVVMITGRR